MKYSPVKTSIQAELLVHPAEFFAMHIYSPASSKLIFTNGRRLTLEMLSWRGCRGNISSITPTLSQDRKKMLRYSLNHFLTVRGLRSGDPSGPRRSLSFLNHWRRVVAGRWTLHTSLAWPPTSTVVFSGKPDWRVGRCTLESGRMLNKKLF